MSDQAAVGETEIVRAQVPVEVGDALRRLAERSERSLSAEIRLALRAHVADANAEIAA